MRLQRLLGMSTAEIVCRSQQGTAKTVDRLLAPGRRHNRQGLAVLNSLKQGPELDRLRELHRQGQDEIAAGELLNYFRQRLPARFFEGVADGATVELIRKHCPDHMARVQRSADDVCACQFEILGYGKLSYGSPVNWHLDPVAGTSAALCHWSQINALDCNSVGDNKVIWELNRHQWMLDLGQAYRFTGDERYARVYAELLQDWLRHNPVGFGINWHSSLEVAMRLISWCWALMFFRQSAAMTASLFAALLESIRQHARHIETYLSYYFSPNTHLTGEALGLCYAGMLFPEFKESRRWRSLGETILKQQIGKQVYSDGVYFEQSTRYQYYTVDIYLHFIVLCGRNGIPVPLSLTERVRSMLEFLLAVQHPNGDMPQIGDTDGGWLLPLVRRAPADFRMLFALGALLFRRGDFVWAAGAEIAPEALWLVGQSGMKIRSQIDAVPPADFNPAVFRQGGIAVLRNGWECDSHQLILDFGPLGCRHSAGHGHADLLSIQCSVFGEPYIVDAGTGNYRADSQWRSYFRSADAHSTVTVDGRNHAEPDGPFSWRGERPTANLERCEINANWQLLQASRKQNNTVSGPVTHRRRVLFAITGWWLVIDELIGKGEHEMTATFQFAPLTLRRQSDQWIRACGKQGNALSLRCFCSSEIKVDIATGAMAPPKGWISPNYGQHIPAPAVTFTVKDKLPLRMITVFVPHRDASAATPPVSMAEFAGVTELRLDLERCRQLVSISGNNVHLEEAA